MAQFPIDLQAFKSALYDICRPNRFTVQWDDPATLDSNQTDAFFLKACSIPGKTIGEIDLNWCGYKYKIAGDPTFGDVTMTFYNSINAAGDTPIRDYFEQWLNLITDDESNVRAVADKYKTTVIIEQLDGNGNSVQTYKLWFAHPKDISEIALAMDTNDTVEEFNVIFSFSYFTTGEDPEVGGNPAIFTPAPSLMSGIKNLV